MFQRCQEFPKRLSFKPELVCCSFADHNNVRDHIVMVIMVLLVLVTTLMTIVTMDRSQDGVLRCCITFVLVDPPWFWGPRMLLIIQQMDGY